MVEISDQNSGYFPFKFYEDFLNYVYQNREIIKVVSYDDFDWGDDYGYEFNYVAERKNWQEKLKTGQVDPSKIYLVIQHDVDNVPELTLKAMEAEKKFGFYSNIMLFNNRVLRRHFQDTGELLFDTDRYQIDRKMWKKFENDGFVFCYHANPYEQSGFCKKKALEIFENDVVELRRDFNIRYFSPHGGARSPDGESNNCLPIPEGLSNNIRWVANNHSMRFDGVFSDGGPNSKARDPSKRNLKDFVATWKPGGRYRVLTHPQYYCDENSISERMNEASWYREMQECYSHGDQDYWGDACLNTSKDGSIGSTSIYKPSLMDKLVEFLKHGIWRPYVKKAFNKYFR